MSETTIGNISILDGEKNLLRVEIDSLKSMLSQEQARSARYRQFVEQFVSEEMVDGEDGRCVFCFGENMHTVGCLWRNAKEALLPAKDAEANG